MKKLIGVFILSLAGCAIPQENMNNGSSIMSVGMRTDTTLSKEEAQAVLQSYCAPGSRKAYFESVANVVNFQAGYVQHFDGLGHAYRLKTRNTITGQKGWFRADRGQSYSRNGMGMFPVSENFDHYGLFNASCDVAEAALKGLTGYNQVKLAQGKADGQLADGKIDTGECLIFDLGATRNRRTSDLAFCKTAFVSTSLAKGSGAPSEMAVIFQ